MAGCVQNTSSVNLVVALSVLEATVNVSPQAGNQLSILSDGLFSSGAPTGAVVPFAGASAPVGWLICDGSPVSRTTYAALFAIIGMLYGAGDGVATFNLPDARGRAIYGFAAAGGHASVSTLGGNESATLAQRAPYHLHSNSLTLPNHGHSDTISFADSGHAHAAGSLTGTILDPALKAGGSIGGGTNFNVDTQGTSVTITGSTASAAAVLGKSGAVGNPTSNPPIPGTIGSGFTTDTGAFLVLNHIVKT